MPDQRLQCSEVGCPMLGPSGEGSVRRSGLTPDSVLRRLTGPLGRGRIVLQVVDDAEDP